MIRPVKRALLALAFSSCALPALAQPPAAQFPGGFAPGSAIEGWDTSAQQRCVVGASATCTAAPGQAGGTGGGGAVYGPSGAGAPPSNPPVYTGGLGTDGFLHGRLTDAAGREYVDVYSLPSGTNTLGSVTALGSNGGALATDASNRQIIVGRGPATATQTSVSVPANTSTQVIAANATRRGLQIVPAAATCSMNDAGGTASATSKPIPGGWNYTELDPPPSSAVTVACTSATTVSVTELN